MSDTLILASGSETRATLLRNAGLVFDIVKPRVDEDAIKASLVAEQATPRDIADALAEMKALRVADRHPSALVLGSDQVLDFKGRVFSKPETPQDAFAQLSDLRGQTHKLLSAAVIYDQGKPVWRHVGETRLTMRDISDTALTDYIDRNWPSISHSVGGYKIEEEGVRLFSRIEGDYFTVLGLPLIEVLSYLTLRGFLPK